MSEYPKMVYHTDGRVAVAASAHERAHTYSDWEDTPSDVHRKHPDGGRMVPTAQVADPLMGTTRADPIGPLDAGTMRAILREELTTHPGFDGAIIAPILQGIVRAELGPLYAALGVDPMALGTPSAPKPETLDIPNADPVDLADGAPRRRGRPPGSANKLADMTSADPQE